jgi:hypothetical protein
VVQEKHECGCKDTQTFESFDYISVLAYHVMMNSGSFCWNKCDASFEFGIKEIHSADQELFAKE